MLTALAYLEKILDMKKPNDRNDELYRGHHSVIICLSKAIMAKIWEVITECL
jgi:hypothetical protein